MGQHDDGYDPDEHPIKELGYILISPIGWVLLMIILVLV